jgi:hypothetical protein
MYLLQSKPLEHRTEMVNLLKYENKSLGDFPGLDKYLKELDATKSELSFEKGSTPKSQKPTITIMQEKIEQYIQILYNFTIHFEIPKKKPVAYQIGWKGESGSICINANFYFEIACMYYNYSVLYFNQGHQLLAEKDPKAYKTALRYFRIALWGFQEIQNCILKCVNTGTFPDELKSMEVNACYQLCLAYGYKCLYLFLQSHFATFTQDQINTLHRTVFSEFNKACFSLDQIKGKQFVDFKMLKMMVRTHQNYHLGWLYYNKACEYAQRHKDNVSEKHLGTQIAFITGLKQNLKEIENALSVLKDQESQSLLNDINGMVKKLKDLELENNKVYKNVIPGLDKLPLGEDSEQKVKPLDQPQVKKKLDDLSKICAGKYSGYYKQLENDLNLSINKNKNNLNALIENIEIKKLNEYKKNNIDVILRMVLSGTEESLENRIKEIQKIYGGLHGYENIIKDLEKMGSENDAKAKKIKSIIEQDHIRDKEFHGQYGIKVLGIKEASNGLLENFMRHGTTLTGLRKKDAEIFEIYGRHKNLLKDIDSGKINKDLENMQTGIQNSEDVQNLVNKHQLLNQIFKIHVDPKKKNLFDFLKSQNIENILQDVFFNNRRADDVFKELNDNLADKIEEFRNMIEQMKKALGKITEIAEKINKDMSNNSSSLTYQQTLLSDINEVHLLYSMLLNNMEMHDNLLKGANCLEQIMNDYLLSKDTQKQEIIKNLNNFTGVNISDFINNQFQSKFGINPGNFGNFGGKM